MQLECARNERLTSLQTSHAAPTPAGVICFTSVVDPTVIGTNPSHNMSLNLVDGRREMDFICRLDTIVSFGQSEEV